MTGSDKIDKYEKSVSNLSFSWTNNFKENPSYKVLFNNFFVLLDSSWSVFYNNSPFLGKEELNELLKKSNKHKKIFEDDWYIMHLVGK